MNERFYFRHVIRASHNGPVAKSRSMLNIAIFDPWQRSLFSRQRTPGKEPLLAGKTDLISIAENLINEKNSGYTVVFSILQSGNHVKKFGSNFQSTT